MASFAKIGLNNKVIEVHSVVNEVLHDSNGAEREDIGIDFLTKLHGWSIWVQTSYNTRGGIHYQPNSNIPSEDQSKSLRKNYAGIGYIYDEDRDAFISKKPFNSWVLNETTCLWEAPVAKPNDENMYSWNESTLTWDIVEV
jgi:hypothetical protein